MTINKTQNGNALTITLEGRLDTITSPDLEKELSSSLDAAAKEAWDELEKSVVAKVADDVKVAIRGRTVEMTIVKKLN